MRHLNNWRPAHGRGQARVHDSDDLLRFLSPARREATRTVETPLVAVGSAQPVVDLDAGLPALLEEAERVWLVEAMRRYSSLTRAELAAKLKISESALYKKLRIYGLGS